MKDQWLEWLQAKQRHFFYGVIFILASLFITFQLVSKYHKKTTGSYFSANEAFSKWLHQGQPLEELKSALKKRPDLEAKFGAMVASKFIMENQGDKAQPFADKVFQRVLHQSPQHTAFAEGSLLIAQGHYRDALTGAVSLKNRLTTSSLLNGFTLVRIASLYRVLEARDQEVDALDELEQFLEKGSESGAILLECFKEDNLTLSDYISQRKKELL